MGTLDITHAAIRKLSWGMLVPVGVGWGRRVGATAGMLDDSWFNRTIWLVDGRDQGELLEEYGLGTVETAYELGYEAAK